MSEAGDDKQDQVFYENADLFRLQSDPFGQDFEQSLQGAPALPVRRGRYSRQSSRSSASSKKSSYDEMSINAGRPVIASERDPLSAVTFESPLKDLETSKPSQPTPVPAPRFSKMRSQSTEERGEESSYCNEVIYEELVPKEFPSHLSTSAAEPPSPQISLSRDADADPPPSTSFGVDERKCDDNIYSELDPPPPPLFTSSREDVSLLPGRKSLLEEGDDDGPSEALSPTLSTQLSDPRAEVGAKLATLDIRKDVNRLWDMAVEELHKEETFVQYLESRESLERSKSDSRPGSNAYDSVAIPEQRFKIVNGVQVPIPITLLKDFDPCFEGQDENAKENEEQESRKSFQTENSDEEEHYYDKSSSSTAADDFSIRKKQLTNSIEQGHRDSTTSASSVDIPPPNEPPPPPPPPPTAETTSTESTKPPRPYENVWMPDESGAGPVLEEPGNLGEIAMKGPKQVKTPPPVKPKRLSKQISSSFTVSDRALGEGAATGAFAPLRGRPCPREDLQGHRRGRQQIHGVLLEDVDRVHRECEGSIQFSSSGTSCMLQRSDGSIFQCDQIDYWVFRLFPTRVRNLVNRLIETKG